jgi:hypothetical protein
MDIVYFAGIVLFCALMVALAMGCDKLGSNKPGSNKSGGVK